MTQVMHGSSLVNLPRQIFYFAVLDGDNPRRWEPWDGDKRTFEAFYQECADVMRASNSEPRASFEPILEPVDALLSSKRLHGVVGVIIDAKADPNDLSYYHAKMESLESLCAQILHSAPPERRLLRKVERFEIWFVTDELEIEKWLKWSTMARDIVNRAFGQMPRIDYLTTGSLFPQAARRFLSDSRYFMVSRP